MHKSNPVLLNLSFYHTCDGEFSVSFQDANNSSGPLKSNIVCRFCSSL